MSTQKNDTTTEIPCSNLGQTTVLKPVNRDILEHQLKINADTLVHNYKTTGKHFSECYLFNGLWPTFEGTFDLDAQRLDLTITGLFTYGKKNTQTISLQAHPCNFGGRRWYWRCPGCNKPRMTLYYAITEWAFYCRKCLGLAYDSQNRSYHQPSGRRPVSIVLHQWGTLGNWVASADRRARYRKARRNRFLSGKIA
ncbi:MAG: hypothetical protein ABL949_13635 [Fimbriimonadaceae bacterium]